MKEPVPRAVGAEISVNQLWMSMESTGNNC